jgi:hypothetical protein
MPLIEATRAAPPPKAVVRNRFDRAELAGPLGDFGTLIPFAVAYTNLLGLDPFGMLLAFGVSMVVVGTVYKTPFPVQPMKAICTIATTQAAQTITVTPGAVYGALILLGSLLLFLALFLSPSVGIFFRMVSSEILGVILFLAGPASARLVRY